MRLGVLGGTFDPPHNGHFALAHAAMEILALDEVMLLPASRNPLKKQARGASAKDRLEMVKLGAKSEPQMSVADIEIQRGGASYAYDTLFELSYARPGEYWFILGSDALRDIDSWKQAPKLLRMCRLAAALREGQDMEKLKMSLPKYAVDVVDFIQMPPVDISSTELRQRIMLGRPVSQWLDPKVEKYIVDHKLYRS